MSWHGRRPGNSDTDTKERTDSTWEDIRGRGGQTWQDYAAAIERHTTLVEAPPPPPVNDAGKLSPAFVKWMMTLPPGWVTGGLDLPRTTQLKILGNGVLPIQAETAYRSLLAG